MRLRSFFVLILLTALAACSGARMVSLEEVSRAGATVVPILVASTRNVTEDGQFGRDRGDGLSFGRFDVSVPPKRRVGEVSLPGWRTNPRRHFAMLNSEVFNGEAMFRSQIAAQLVGRRKGARNAVVFVHGYNTSYEDGLYRFAQFYTDLGLEDVPVHYSWPSGQNLLRYGYDRDSMLFARDGFEDMLRDIVDAGAERILIVGHSMGSMLIMETLREIAIARDERVRGKIGGVILVSPDIDLDVFRGQVARIGELPQPFVIFSSKRDRVLSFAANEIYGDKPRLGNLEMEGELSDLDVTVVDVSDYSTGILNHATAITSPAFIKIVGNMSMFTTSFDEGPGARGTGFPDAFIAVDKNAGRLQVGPFQRGFLR